MLYKQWLLSLHCVTDNQWLYPSHYGIITSGYITPIAELAAKTALDNAELYGIAEACNDTWDWIYQADYYETDEKLKVCTEDCIYTLPGNEVCLPYTAWNWANCNRVWM